MTSRTWAAYCRADQVVLLGRRRSTSSGSEGTKRVSGARYLRPRSRTVASALSVVTLAALQPHSSQRSGGLIGPGGGLAGMAVSILSRGSARWLTPLPKAAVVPLETRPGSNSLRASPYR
jgi:hypothetical protein